MNAGEATSSAELAGCVRDIRGFNVSGVPSLANLCQAKAPEFCMHSWVPLVW